MAVNDGRVVLRNCHLIASAEHFDSGLFELETCVFANHNTACQDGNILEHSLATVSEAWSLDCTNLELSAKAVHDECCKSLAINIFCNDEQGTTTLNCGFEDGQEVLQVRNLLVVDEDVGVLHHALHLFRIGHKVSAQIAAVKLHAFHNTDCCVTTLGFFDGDDAVLAYFLHGISKELADFRVVVGAYGSHLFNLMIVGSNGFRLLFDALDDSSDCLVNTALQVHWIGTCSHVLQAFAYDSLSQYGCCGCSVACIVASLACHALNELCTSVLESVCELHFFSDCDAILSDLRSAELLLDDNVATLRTESHLDCICQLVNALLHHIAGFEVKFNIFCHFIQFLIHNS